MIPLPSYTRFQDSKLAKEIETVLVHPLDFADAINQTTFDKIIDLTKELDEDGNPVIIHLKSGRRYKMSLDVPRHTLIFEG